MNKYKPMKMIQQLKTYMLLICLTILSSASFADRIETERILYQSETLHSSNVVLNGRGKIVMQDGSTINTNSFMALDEIQYPVFIIPLMGWNGWSEIELKASTNNFDPSKEEIDRLVYYYESSQISSFGHADTNANVYICDAGTPDAWATRCWVKVLNTMTLTQQIGIHNNYQDTVIVSPSLTVRDGSINYWMVPNNENLVWSYSRRTAAYAETNTLGRQIWHPIFPSEWRKKRLNIHF